MSRITKHLAASKYTRPPEAVCPLSSFEQLNSQDLHCCTGEYTCRRVDEGLYELATTLSASAWYCLSTVHETAALDSCHFLTFFKLLPGPSTQRPQPTPATLYNCCREGATTLETTILVVCMMSVAMKMEGSDRSMVGGACAISKIKPKMPRYAALLWERLPRKDQSSTPPPQQQLN